MGLIPRLERSQLCLNYMITFTNLLFLNHCTVVGSVRNVTREEGNQREHKHNSHIADPILGIPCNLKCI